MASRVNESQYLSFKSENNENLESGNEPALIHKILNVDEEFYEIYIKSKHIKIFKTQKIIPIT